MLKIGHKSVRVAGWRCALTSARTVPGGARMERRELSFGELVEGAIAAGDNATKLSHDARVLIGRNRPATALALGITSLEEWGKSFQLIVSANMVAQGIPIDWNEFWNSFYNHRPKQFLA